MDFSAPLAPHAWIWWTIAFLYNPAVVSLQQIAPALKPWQNLIKQAWGIWSLSYAIFSLFGFLSVVRVYVAMLGNISQLCTADSPAAVAFWDEHYTGPVYDWVLWFTGSQLLKLGDTMLLAALGQPIMFLHWYHHLTILTYTFIGALNWHPHMISGVTWTFGVHAVMYAHYASSCYGIRWPKYLARKIKAFQIAQILAQLALLVAACWYCGLNYHVSFWPNVALVLVCTCQFVDMRRQQHANKPVTPEPEAAQHPAAGKARCVTEPWQSYLTIDAYDYDITEFARMHPGGGVIRHYTGLDATAAFREFHSTCTKANRVLQTLPRRPHGAVADTAPARSDCMPASTTDTDKRAVSNGEKGSLSKAREPQPTATTGCNTGHDPLVNQAAVHDTTSTPASHSDAAVMADFAAWRDSLVAKGLFKPRPTWQLVWFLSEPIILTVAACWAMRSTGSHALGVLLISLASTRTGWIQHEGGHNSLTRVNKVDKFLQTFAIGLGLSMSGWVWNSMHNKHHATPNKINYDIDLNTLPLVAFYKGCVEKDNRARGVSRPLLYKWLRAQAYTFLPVTCMTVSVLWSTFLHPIKAWKHDKLGLAVMALSQVARPALFVVFGRTTFLQGFLLNMLCFWLTSMYMFGHFALSHTFMPVVEEHDHVTWVRFALEHSVDISPGNWLVDWVMGYLNYQVIHHLFPSMPQCYGPIISRELKIKAQEWGIKYTTMPYFAAWRAMLANLDAVGSHYFAEAANAHVKLA